MENKVKAVVFVCYVNGLSIIRSLGRHGIPVVAADYNSHPNPLGFFSKYIVEKTFVPNPQNSPKRFLAFLLSKSDEWAGSVLIPTSDEILEALSYHKPLLSKFYIVAVPDWNALKNILNKKVLYEEARKVAVPTPVTICPSSMESLLEHKSEYVYPCVLKPCLTHLFTPKFRKKVFIIRNFSELKSKFEYAQKLGLEMMIQEIIPGKADKLYTYAAYYDLKGEPLAEYTSRELRQKPPMFGGPRIMEITETHEIVKHSRKLLFHLLYTGLCNIEYKKDGRDGKFKLLDLNARSGMSISLPISNGVDFPWIMYNNLVLHEKIRLQRHDKYKTWTHLCGDVKGFIRHFHEESWGIRDYLYPYFARNHFPVLAWDDPLPYFMEWFEYISTFFKKSK